MTQANPNGVTLDSLLPPEIVQAAESVGVHKANRERVSVAVLPASWGPASCLDLCSVPSP
jgi:hypothetical protein